MDVILTIKSALKLNSWYILQYSNYISLEIMCTRRIQLILICKVIACELVLVFSIVLQLSLVFKCFSHYIIPLPCYFTYYLLINWRKSSIIAAFLTILGHLSFFNEFGMDETPFDLLKVNGWWRQTHCHIYIIALKHEWWA